MIIILSVLTFIYIAWLCGHKPTACMNTILTSATTEPRFLYLLYFITTFIHLFSLVIMFSCFSKGSVRYFKIFLSFLGSDVFGPWNRFADLAYCQPRTVFYQQRQHWGLPDYWWHVSFHNLLIHSFLVYTGLRWSSMLSLYSRLSISS